MLGDLFSIVAPVFVCAGIGFAWARMGRAYDTELVTTLITNIGAPCLVFATFMRVDLEPAAFWSMALAAVASMVVFAALGMAILKAAGLSFRAFLPGLMFPNSGNMGLPLCLLAFGPEGLALAIAYFAIISTGNFTIGVGISSGAASLGRLARIPILYAVAAAMFFMFSPMEAPKWLTNTSHILGGMTIPMMLITLGISLARLRVARLKTSLGLALLRLVMGFGVGVGLAAVLGFDGTARGVLIIQSSMPCAVFCYLFSQRYQRSPEQVAGMVVISSAVSFLTLPLLMWYVL